MSARPDWIESNRRHLLAELHELRGHLERLVRERAGASAPPDADARIGPATDGSAATAIAAEVWSEPPASGRRAHALNVLAHRFRLTPFERALLVLTAGPELDGEFGALLSAATGLVPGQATFSLALAALPDAHWSAITPASPLRRWRLLEVGHGPGLLSSPLRIDERVLHFLVGAPHTDERLRGTVEPIGSVAEPPARRMALVNGLASGWAQSTDAPPHAIALYGGDAELRRVMAAAIARAIGSTVLSVRTDAIPAAADERIDLLRLLERECALSDALLLVEEPEPAERVVLSVLDELNVPLILSASNPPPPARRAVVAAEIEPLSHDEMRSAWEAALGERVAGLNGALDRVAGCFRLGLAGVAAVGTALRATPEPEIETDRVWLLCRAYARPRLEGLAQRITPAARWPDLVLPVSQMESLRAIALHVRHRATVYEQWGFADGSGRGLGIAALFAGPSGTGKTMAAEVLSNDLRLDLYRIDLSQVVSKYIGETEKNLRKVFDAAEGGSAILLFDEADALFGKRSEVRDSHDRYANIEVSYLLQRMEVYRGLAILTTNLANAIDPAFLRRIRFSVTFPFPDAAARSEIWRRVFPAAAPTDGIDPARLARLSVAGGNIRNIALHAAFYAADADEPVRMTHVLRAARLEYAKIDRTLTETEMGAWA